MQILHRYIVYLIAFITCYYYSTQLIILAAVPITDLWTSPAFPTWCDTVTSVNLYGVPWYYNTALYGHEYMFQSTVTRTGSKSIPIDYNLTSPLSSTGILDESGSLIEIYGRSKLTFPMTWVTYSNFFLAGDVGDYVWIIPKFNIDPGQIQSLLWIWLKPSALTLSDVGNEVARMRIRSSMYYELNSKDIYGNYIYSWVPAGKLFCNSHGWTPITWELVTPGTLITWSCFTKSSWAVNYVESNIPVNGYSLINGYTPSVVKDNLTGFFYQYDSTTKALKKYSGSNMSPSVLIAIVGNGTSAVGWLYYDGTDWRYNSSYRVCDTKDTRELQKISLPWTDTALVENVNSASSWTLRAFNANTWASSNTCYTFRGNWCGDGIVTWSSSTIDPATNFNEFCDDGALNGTAGYCNTQCTWSTPASCWSLSGTTLTAVINSGSLNVCATPFTVGFFTDSNPNNYTTIYNWSCKNAVWSSMECSATYEHPGCGITWLQVSAVTTATPWRCAPVSATAGSVTLDTSIPWVEVYTWTCSHNSATKNCSATMLTWSTTPAPVLPAWSPTWILPTTLITPNYWYGNHPETYTRVPNWTVAEDIAWCDPDGETDDISILSYNPFNVPLSGVSWVAPGVYDFIYSPLGITDLIWAIDVSTYYYIQARTTGGDLVGNMMCDYWDSTPPIVTTLVYYDWWTNTDYDIGDGIWSPTGQIPMEITLTDTGWSGLKEVEVEMQYADDAPGFSAWNGTWLRVANNLRTTSYDTYFHNSPNYTPLDWNTSILLSLNPFGMMTDFTETISPYTHGQNAESLLFVYTDTTILTWAHRAYKFRARARDYALNQSEWNTGTSIIKVDTVLPNPTTTELASVTHGKDFLATSDSPTEFWVQHFVITSDPHSGSPIVEIRSVFEDVSTPSQFLLLEDNSRDDDPADDSTPENDYATLDVIKDISKVSNDYHTGTEFWGPDKEGRVYVQRIIQICDEAGNCAPGNQSTLGWDLEPAVVGNPDTPTTYVLWTIYNSALQGVRDFYFNVYANPLWEMYASETHGSWIIRWSWNPQQIANGTTAELEISLKDGYDNPIIPIKRTSIDRKLQFQFLYDNSMYLDQYNRSGESSVFIATPDDLIDVIGNEQPLATQEWNGLYERDIFDITSWIPDFASTLTMTHGSGSFQDQPSVPWWTGSYPFRFKVYTPTKHNYRADPDAEFNISDAQVIITHAGLFHNQANSTPVKSECLIANAPSANNPDCLYDLNPEVVDPGIHLDFSPMYTTVIRKELRDGGFIEGAVQESDILFARTGSRTAMSSNFLELEFSGSTDVNQFNFKGGTVRTYVDNTPIASLAWIKDAITVNPPATGTPYDLFTRLLQNPGYTVGLNSNLYLSTHLHYQLDGKDILYNSDIMGRGNFHSGTTYDAMGSQRDVKIVGSTTTEDASNLVSGQLLSDLTLIGQVSKFTSKSDIIARTHQFIRNIQTTPIASWLTSTLINDTTSFPAGWSAFGDIVKLSNNKSVLYIHGNGTSEMNYAFPANTGSTVWISGKRTLVLKWVNLYIKGNMYYDDLEKDVLGIVVLKDESGFGWSVYIDPSVTNIVGTIFAEKSIMSYDGTNFLDPDTSASILKNQLHIFGTVISENTIGGSRLLVPKCPYFLLSGCSYKVAQRYDLNFLRRYYLVDAWLGAIGWTAWIMVPAGTHITPTTTVAGGWIVDKTSGNVTSADMDLIQPFANTTEDLAQYPVIIEYNPVASSNPPPVYDGVYGTAK